MESNNLSRHLINVQIFDLDKECTIHMAHGFHEVPVAHYCEEARGAVKQIFLRRGWEAVEVSNHMDGWCPCDARRLCEGQTHFFFLAVQDDSRSE